jgi:hypothetical protein
MILRESDLTNEAQALGVWEALLEMIPKTNRLIVRPESDEVEIQTVREVA